METDEELRRFRLREWINVHYDANVSEFCRVTRKHQPHIADALSGKKPFGEKLARSIEAVTPQMPARYLDERLADGLPLAKAQYHGIMLSRAAALLGAEWDRLDVGDRIEIENEIHAKLAKKIRAARKSQEPRDHKDDN
jgi:hypothetical protein